MKGDFIGQAPVLTVHVLLYDSNGGAKPSAASARARARPRRAWSVVQAVGSGVRPVGIGAKRTVIGGAGVEVVRACALCSDFCKV